MASVNVLYESVDVERLTALIAYEGLAAEERDQLGKYKKKYQLNLSNMKIYKIKRINQS